MHSIVNQDYFGRLGRLLWQVGVPKTFVIMSVFFEEKQCWNKLRVARALLGFPSGWGGTLFDLHPQVIDAFGSRAQLSFASLNSQQQQISLHQSRSLNNRESNV